MMRLERLSFVLVIPFLHFVSFINLYVVVDSWVHLNWDPLQFVSKDVSDLVYVYACRTRCD